MIELLLLAALTWPPECTVAGDIYEAAAQLRDTGVSRERALNGTKTHYGKKAVLLVYEGKELTARDWKFIAIGTCVGLWEHDQEENKNGSDIRHRRDPGKRSSA